MENDISRAVEEIICRISSVNEVEAQEVRRDIEHLRVVSGDLELFCDEWTEFVYKYVMPFKARLYIMAMLLGESGGNKNENGD